MDGLTGMQAICISYSGMPKCYYKVVGTPVGEKVGITVHDFAYKAVGYIGFKVVSSTNCWNFFSVQTRLSCKYLPQTKISV